jgi:NAD-dependent SIR2 family protein deacetylase
MNECINCGNKKFTLVKQELHMQVFKCDSCGEIYNSLISPDPGIYDEEDVSVDVVWYNKEPTAKDVLSLRKLFPSILNSGVSEILSEIKAEHKWHAGIYSAFHANELKEKAAELNLSLILKKTAA